MTERRQRAWRATFATAAVLAAALAGVATVWGLAAWWSFAEQTRGAGHLGFAHPAVLPWTVDGLAFSLALVALAAALDGRPAPLARLGVLAALAGSVWANRLGVQLRTPDGRATDEAVRMAAVAPLSAFVAFEVILAAIRRLVMRWRGLPAPAPIPALRPVRVLLAPVVAVREWRAAVLAVTAPQSAGGRGSLPPAGPDTAGPGVPPVRAGGPHVDAALDGPRVHGPSPAPTAGAADSGPVDAPADVHQTAPTAAPSRPVDDPADAPVDTVQPVHRTGRQRAGGRRNGSSTTTPTGPSTGHSPGRQQPDWRTVDWYAVVLDRGVKRARAYEIMKADPDAVEAARGRLRAMNGSAP